MAGLVLPSRPRATALALATLYLASLLFRLRLRDTIPFLDESGFYYVSKTLGQLPTNVVDVYGPIWYYPGGPYFWERPLYYLILWPGAQLGFHAYRLEHLAITAILPVLIVVLLRLRGTPWAVAYGAGLAAAAYPALIRWSVTGLMDELMAVFFLSALVAAELRHPRTSALLFLAAVWTKESAIFGFGFVVAWSVLEKIRAGEGRWWPPRLDEQQTAWLLALPVALFPLHYADMIGLYYPGGDRAGQPFATVFEALLLSAWFLPLLLLGLRWRRTQFLTGLALLYIVFYCGLVLVAERNVRDWYLPLPVTLTIVACAQNLGAWWRRSDHAARVRRMAPRVTAAAAGLLLLALVTLPASQAKDAWLTPFAEDPRPSLPEFYRAEDARDQALWPALDALLENDPKQVLAIDVWGGFVLYPISERVERVVMGYTGFTIMMNQSLDEWSRAIEGSDGTLIEKIDNPLNAAITDTYRDCVVFESEKYVVLRGGGCSGRIERLQEEYSARREAP